MRNVELPTNSAMVRQPRDSRNDLQVRRWVNRLLVAAAVAYGLDLVCLLAWPGDGGIALGMLMAACGLVVLACLVGAWGAAERRFRPAMAANRQHRQARDEWVAAWEGLAQRPVK